MRIWELLSEEQLNELTFKGSPCTKDCSGHIAGYKWGELHPGVIADGPSNSFNNGTKIAAAERKKRRAGIPRRGQPTLRGQQQPLRGQPGFTPRSR